MPSTWKDALLSYRWSVRFEDFKYAQQFPGWFAFDLTIGDRFQTMEFEAHFRKRAQKNLEAWLEVVFWKLYGIGIARDKTTQAVATYFQDRGISAESLWRACKNYIMHRAQPHLSLFDGFSDFGIKLSRLPLPSQHSSLRHLTRWLTLVLPNGSPNAWLPTIKLIVQALSSLDRFSRMPVGSSKWPTTSLCDIGPTGASIQPSSLIN